MSKNKSNSEPREYTDDEVAELLLEHIWASIHFWSKQGGSKEFCISGFAFNLLSTLSGTSLSLPGFIVAPSPCEEDKEYLKSIGENWFPYNSGFDVECDIGRVLRDSFHEVGHRMRTINRGGE